MKKKVLLSVFAASLFAAPAAFAQGHGVSSENNRAEEGFATSANFFGAGENELAPEVHADLTKTQTASSKAKTGAANNAVVDEKGVLREKGKKAMAPKAGAKPAGKVLPKTSAAK